METNEQEIAEFTARQFQVETEIKEVELRIETLRQEAEKELEIAELKYQASLDKPKKQKADVEAEIRKFRISWRRAKARFRMARPEQKGMAGEYRKVVDEEAILYNNVLNPQLVADSSSSLSSSSSSSTSASLYGVSINLAAVERNSELPRN